MSYANKWIFVSGVIYGNADATDAIPGLPTDITYVATMPLDITILQQDVVSPWDYIYMCIYWCVCNKIGGTLHILHEFIKELRSF